MPSEITKRICFLAIFVCITANCLAQEKTELPGITIIERAEGDSKVKGGAFEIKIGLGTGRIAIMRSTENDRQFTEFIKDVISKEQKDFLEKSKFSLKSLGVSNRRIEVVAHAVSIKDAEIMAYKIIEFFNDLAERNLKNLPNEVIEAKKKLQEYKQKKLKAEEELTEVKKQLEGLREYPSEYAYADMERVKTEFNDLRFLKKKTDIEIVGIKARIEKAQAVRVSGEVGVIQQHVMKLYTEAEIMYADARARNAHVSELIEKYLLAITLYNKSRKLPKTIGSLASIARSKNKSISWLESEINDPESLRDHRKPLNVLDITIYDNSKNLKN